MKTRSEFRGFVPEGAPLLADLDPFAKAKESEKAVEIDYDRLAAAIVEKSRGRPKPELRQEGSWTVSNLFGGRNG